MTSSATRSAPAATADSTLALVAAGTTVLAWGSAFVAIRWVGTSLDPGPLALGRLLVASVILGGMVLARRRWVAPTPREWRLLVVCGLAWFAVYNVALNAGEQRVDAGTAALVISVGPVLIAIAAGLLLGEGFPRWLVAGAAVAVAGTTLIGVATARGDGTDLLGVVFCLVAAVTYAIGVLCQKVVLRRLSAMQVTWLACTIGAVACLPFAPSLVDEAGRASTGALAALGFLGIVPTALAFVTWAYALARMDAGRLGVVTYLVSPVAVGLGALLLGELPALLALVGGAVCLAGVALSHRRPADHPG